MSNKTNSYGFFQPDLNIELLESIDIKIDPVFPQIIKGFYSLIYIVEGEYEVVYKENTFNTTKGALIISDKEHYFNFRRITKTGSVLKIHLQESALTEFKKYDIFNFFYQTPPATCIYPATFIQTICFNVLNSMKEALAKHYNEYYIKTKILTILSELDLYFKGTNNEDTSDKTNSAIKIIEFVDKNFSSQITYKTIKDKFFVSDSFINKAFKNICNQTLKEYLNYIRLSHANELMDNKYKKISLINVAKLCGFSTYSTFYREYVKAFGVSPKIVQDKNIEKWKKLN